MLVTKRLTLKEAERLSAIYFYCGFLCLPFLWFLHASFFWKYRSQSPILKRHVYLSIILSIVGLLLFVAYCLVMRYAFADSSLWVIKPDGDGHQTGYFADQLYNQKNQFAFGG